MRFAGISITAVLLACLALPATVRADRISTYWQAGIGNWSTAANWDNGEPIAGDYAYINNGGTAQITAHGEICDFLWLGRNAGDSGTVQMTSGSLSVSFYEDIGYHGTGTFNHAGGTNSLAILRLGYESDGNGIYELSNSGSLSAWHEHIGDSGTGRFTQTGGTNAITSEPAGILYIGTEAGASGTYELSNSGSLSAGMEHIGHDGDGSFVQSGGTNTVSNTLFVGRNAGATGTYSLSAGQLVAQGEHIGYQGTSGSLTQTGGTNSAGFIGIGGIGCSGTYTLNNGNVSASHEQIGGYGTMGTFNQAGGTNTVTDYLNLGWYSGSHGTYNLTGGTLSAPDERIGEYEGSGTFYHSGGTNHPDNLHLGYSSGVTGTYELSGTGDLSAEYEYVGRYGFGNFTQTGGTNTVASVLYLGRYSGADGMYDLSGGALSAGSIRVGYYGIGQLNWSGGTLAADSIDVSNGSMIVEQNWTYDGELDIDSGGAVYLGSNSLTLDAPGAGATADMSGGTLFAYEQYVGWDNNATFEQAGGTNTINGTLCLACNPGSSGTYRLLAGGTLHVADAVTGGAGASSLILDGGTLDLDASISVGSLTVGEHHYSVYAQSDGTNSVNDLWLGLYSGTEGTYELSGAGQLLAAWVEFVGDAGTGSFVQTGGTNTVYGRLSIGNLPGSSGAYELSGGELSAGTENVGRGGTGTFTQTGGTNTVANELCVGMDPSSSGTYTISGGSLSPGVLDVGFGGSGTFNIDDASAQITISQLLGFGPDSTFAAVPGSTIHMTGSDFENANTNEVELAGLSNLHLIFEGGTADTDDLEVACEDKLAVTDGYIDNFALDTLTLGGVDVGMIRLVDNTDNGNRGGVGGNAEALYVDTLVLNAGAVLDLNGLHLYWYTEFIDNGGTILNGHVRQVEMPGDFDRDGDVDVADFEILAGCMEGPDQPCSLGCEDCDFDGDGDVDLHDFAAFQVLATGSF
ncbi:MAG: hypothetical protein KAY37_16910 [Phycisphaerae bacterium]|nr:hypothetical protein [Phycisphaerae bacterium]